MENEFDHNAPFKDYIEKAIDLLNRELDPNIYIMAKRAGLIYSTLRRRFCGQSTSQAIANSEYR
jgi:hypothetical protein